MAVFFTGVDDSGPDTLMRKKIKPAALKAGIRFKGWHTLRHTYSTLLKANGNDPKVVQELLRHANLKTTMDTYTQSSLAREAHRSWGDPASGTTSGTTAYVKWFMFSL